MSTENSQTTVDATLKNKSFLSNTTFQALFRKLNTKSIIIAAIALNTLFSFILWQSDNPVNPDGILYLRTADTFLQHYNLSETFALYRWPFYPITIALLSHISGLNLITSAHLINLFLFALIIYSFILLVKELGGELSAQIAAAIIILLFPTFSHAKTLIVRDFGYWGFYLFSVLQLLKFCRQPNWSSTFFFSLGMLFATLFRIEGLLFWLMAPLALMLQNQQSRSWRCKHSVQLHLPFIIVTLIGILLLPWLHKSQELLGRLPELMGQISNGAQLILDDFHTKKIAMQQYVLSYDAKDSAAPILFFGMVGLLIYQIFQTCTWFYTVLFGISVGYRLTPFKNDQRNVLYFFIGTNLIILICFVGEQLFLTSRYVTALALTLMLWTPFTLLEIFKPRNKFPLNPTQRLGLMFFTILLFCGYGIHDIFRVNHSKEYITKAGVWINKNTPANSRLFTNSREIAFYAHRLGVDWNHDFENPLHPFDKIYQKAWKQADYVAVRIARNQIAEESHVITTMGSTPIKVIAASEDEKVLIFQIKQ